MTNNVEMSESIPMDESSNKIHQQKEDDDDHRQCISELRSIFLQVHRCQQEPDKNVSLHDVLSFLNLIYLNEKKKYTSLFPCRE
ncbi:unnamed protein product [Rotaria socialis]|uniref:Uncharacterized protein n=1 Tax=Rotaria socialis TaxID=392032 RepID=A0A817L918_9BILA|nr:unnamed protein product [Rotaria socialis]CAF3262663.1 unnamed protein product [Rotaria socialis]CAF3327000.1 unnamed protein product [Rotaria socialis]CAF3567189.1 unnamed protein product [Rotaria socialis]CAF3574261.1 unnamed protein product [Rotaria socialis]